MFFPEQYDKRSQDLPVALHDAAQFYWGRADSWTGWKPLFDPHSAAVVIPRWRVQDIDTEDDWRRAELIYELSKQRTHSDK
jgi:pseudaminic acid cytidylyltransferase